jgi:polyhydroxyalkanoate synthesis regulator phasin
MNERPKADEGGVAESLRAAIERTLAATGPAAAQTRERAGELVDEIARRGQEARDEIARRGQGAQEELARQLEALEQRMASIEELIRGRDRKDPPDEPSSKPKPEG